ncbi:MAG: PTS sugar transporter subunit IIA, partial [Lachnospiraceae bacterium]|nr:PTS sugar transporter subunit IIA [Lachnospiraceae bacterium]
AQERVRENRLYTRKVNIGVVCASGFGVAQLMMTRLKYKLAGKVVLNAYGKGEINSSIISMTDFFVTTMRLDQLPVDYIQVNPLIPPKDLFQIECKIEEYAHIRREATTPVSKKSLEDVYYLVKEIKSLIHRYRRMETSENIKFYELLQLLAMLVTDSLHAASALRKAVEDREKLHSQVIPELGIVLLHCQSEAVKEPVIISCTPREKGGFKDPYLKGVRAALLMVVPADDKKMLHRDVLGSISSALVTNDGLLNMIKSGEEEEIRMELARELKCFFFDYFDREQR